MKHLLIAALGIALFACNSNSSGSAKGDKLAAKEASIFASVDTSGIKNETDLVAQYKKYLEIKKQKKDVLQEEPRAAIEELSYAAFFITRSASFMNLESEAYKQMDKAMDSLDAIYNQQ
jgi:hypothetical protein